MNCYEFVFIILKQSIDTLKVEANVNIHNQEDIIGMETNAGCVPQVCISQVSRILR
jgi:hypothetical protein